METQEKLTKLLPTDLIAVEVPKDAKEFTIVDLSKERKALHYIIEEYGGYSGFFKDIPNNDFEILGEVTKEKLSVDYKKFPEVSLTGQEASLLLDHNDNIDLRKLLQANGLSWVNEIEKPKEPKSKTSGRMADYFRKNLKWQEAESKLIKGKLIILKPIL